MSKLVIYLVRHAQTSGNVAMTGVCTVRGHKEDLTELGRIQTNLLGMHLSDVKLDAVFSSDYIRAVRTAHGILKESHSPGNLTVQTDRRLREADLGDLDGKPYNDILKHCVALSKPVPEWGFPGGESLREAGERILGFVEEICTDILTGKEFRQPVTTVLIVSHSAALALFLHTLAENSPHQVEGWVPSRDWKLMDNTSYMKIEVVLKSAIRLISPFNSVIISADECELPLFRFTFLDKHASSHLEPVKSITKRSNGLQKFVNANDYAREYASCIQQ